MSYAQNPYMPKVRQAAAHLVLYSKLTPAEVGRRFGVGDSTVAKWVKKAKVLGYHPIPTQSSKPKHHPKELSDEVVKKIVDKRLERGRCSEVVHKEISDTGIKVSLSSVKRKIGRAHV